MFLRALVVSALIASTTLAWAALAHATPITSITHLNSFRDTRSANDVGIGSGDLNQFGADVVPRPGTTVTAVQGGFVVGPIACAGLAVNADFCAAAPLFNPTRSAAWALTFQNGADVAAATTPAIGSIPAAPVPFPTSVTISNSGTTPTLSWIVPPGFTPDAVRVNVFDKSVTLVNGQKDVIFVRSLDATQTSFQIPAANPQNPQQPLLKPNGQYVLNVQLIETRGHVPLLNGDGNDNILRRSSAFFDFSPLTGPQPAAFLPTRGPGIDAPYKFDVRAILANETVFIDPFVAVGYKYAIGAGDPNFKSVLLPAVGDNQYTLSYMDGLNLIQILLGANSQFFFPQGGVGAFEVGGIEVSAGLDPNNVTAFITGLTFVADGQFTGTMTPVVTEIAATPEPATVLLLGASLMGSGLATYRRRRR